MKRSMLILLCIILALSGTLMPVYAEDEIPSVTGITPADGAQEVSPVNLRAEVTFSTAMDMTTISTATVTMNPIGIYKVVPDGSRKVIIYFEKLALGTEYTLRFSDGIKAENGTAITPVTKTFTTMAQPPQYHQLTNGDMENTDDMGVYNDGSQRRSISFTKEGENTVLQLNLGWDEAPVLQKVYLESGKTYEMRAKVKSSAAQNVWFVVNYRTAAEPDTWYHKAGETGLSENTWTDLSATITIPAEALTNDAMDVRIVGKTKGTQLYVDDWQFYEQGYDIEAPAQTEQAGIAETAETMLEDETKDRDMQLLAGLGIYGDNEYTEPDQLVTREKFAQYIATLMGKKGLKATDQAAIYKDIDIAAYDGYAGLMAAEGILLPNRQGNFAPYEAVSYEDACRGFVVALGYQYLLEDFLPISAAARLGVADDVSGAQGERLTYALLNRMLLNALEAEAAVPGNVHVSGQNVMEEFMHITEHTGIVTATQTTSIDSVQTLKPGYIEIDREQYAVTDVDTTELIGKKVRYYVDEGSEEKLILYICDIGRLNQLLTLQAENIMNYSKNYYEYEMENGNIRKATVADDKYLIYNYRALSAYDESRLLPGYGSIELVDNDRDGRYDVVSVLDYQTFVVGSVDKDTGVIYDKFEDKHIAVELTGDVSVLLENGTSNFDAITENDVLTIAQSADGEKAVIYKSNQVITGSVGSIWQTGDGGQIVMFYDEVHGAEITKEVSRIPNYIPSTALRAGDTGIFYLDIFFNLAAYEKTSGEWQFGYFIEAGVLSNVFDKGIALRLLTENDKIESVTCASRIRMDQKVYDTGDEIYAAFSIEPQLIQYKLDTDGKVSSINTENTTEENGLREIATGASSEYRSDSGSLGNKIYIDNDTKVFVAPSETADAENYEYKFAAAKSYLVSGKTYSFTAYSANDSENTAQVLLIKNRPVSNIDNVSVGLVGEIATVLDENNEPVSQLTYLTSSGQRTIVLDDTVDLNNLVGVNNETGLKLEVGDVICWQQRNDGKPYEIKIIFKGNGKALKTESNPNTSTFATAYRTFYGRVKKKEGNLIRLEDEEGAYEIYNAEMYQRIYEYDSADREINEITTGDLSEYVSTDVLVVSAWRAHTLMVVFK